MFRTVTLSLALVVGIALFASIGARANDTTAVYFGDDSSRWASDGECDDPRFEGAGVAWFASDLFRDATDCLALFERGEVTVRTLSGDAEARLVEHGALTTWDGMLDVGQYADIFSFEGTAGDVVAVDLRSAQFDTLVSVESPSGALHENDDHEGSTSRSVLIMTLEETGVYHVLVTSYGPGATGDYTLWINRIDGDVASGWNPFVD